ncbi:MAG TPA: SLATT domain-containing protein [Anaerolineales bacterium]|nr:SLATT domain-containing protein [Anaerolineales bacterium]
METEAEAPKTAPILDVAWKRVAILDDMSKRRSAAHHRIRRWIAILGVLATLLAILTHILPNLALSLPYPNVASVIIKGLFIATPAIASGLAAFASKKYSNGDWLITRAGAEEIQKEIYFFRTILQKKKSRREYLEKRLAEIQRQVYRGLNGEFSFEKYDGQVPPNYYPDDPNSDPGFADLTGEEYFNYRLQDQLKWHNKEILEYKTERDRLTVLILLAGVLGTILAAVSAGNPTWGIWVAFTASITAALIGWQELRNIDVIVRNYSKVVLELTILQDHWVNLEPEERTTAEFYKMVRGCEEVLWAQNTEYIKSMQEALRDASLDEEASLVNRTIQESVESAKRTKKAMQDSLLEYTQETLGQVEQAVDESFRGALNTLVEEASSELVRQELEAMGQAVSETVSETVQNIHERATAFAESIAQIRQEFADVEISKDTPTEDLNTILARYPTTNEVKG